MNQLASIKTTQAASMTDGLCKAIVRSENLNSPGGTAENPFSTCHREDVSTNALSVSQALVASSITADRSTAPKS